MHKDLDKLLGEGQSTGNFIVIDYNASVKQVKDQLFTNQPDHVLIKNENDQTYFLQDGSVLAQWLNDWENKKKIKTFIQMQPDKFDHFSNTGIHADLLMVNGKGIFLDGNDVVGITGIQSAATADNNLFARAAGFDKVINEAGPLLGGNDDGRIGFTGTRSGAKEPGNPNRPYYLNAECADAIAPGELLELDIFLARKEGKKASKQLNVKVGWQLEILVMPKSGFAVEGKNWEMIKVTGEDKSDTLKFNLRATDEGEGVVVISARHRGAEAGSLELKIDINAAVNKKAKASLREGEAFTTIPQAPPDLRLLIHEQETGGKTYLQYQLVATKRELGLYYKSYSVELRTKDAAAFFLDLFNGIDEIPLDTAADKANAVFQMKSKGGELYQQLFPEEMRKTLWSIRNQVTTLVIDSVEPWIPWELCCMQPEDPNEEAEEQFFCELFEVARWIPGKKPPYFSISAEKVAFVIPEDSELPFTEKEQEDIEAVIESVNGTCDGVEASMQGLVSAFSKGEYSIWHFSGHGTDTNSTNPDKYCIILENNEKFSPVNIFGEVRKLGNARPLIFFNACQAGKPGMGLTGISGWPGKFIDADAAAFIGAYWSVHDETAYKFAVKLYEMLAAGNTIAAAMKKARLHIKESGDPTWLAYTLYANPFAVMKK